MRLWSLHPSHLDQKALVAVWREGLLARAVLRGRTRGYKTHPQLDRFRHHKTPLTAINIYLRFVADEADARGYNFDRSKIGQVRIEAKLVVTSGQLHFELEHLRKKVIARAPKEVNRLVLTSDPKAHPLFCVRSGPVEDWEKGAAYPS